MKLFRSPSHSSAVAAGDLIEVSGAIVGARALTMPTDDAKPLEFPALYRRYFHESCRWIRALGAPESELEDLAQEVFVIARRKYGAEELGNPAGWLYRIAWNVVSDYRRRSWWRHLFSRRADVSVEDISTTDGPVEAYDRAERARLLERVLARMSTVRRATFVLFEIEGYTGEEIAALQGIPIKTVWTRLHHARKSFVELVRDERRELEKRMKEKRK